MPLVMEFVGDASRFNRTVDSSVRSTTTKVKTLATTSAASAGRMTSAFSKFGKMLGPLGIGIGVSALLIGIKKIVGGTIAARDEIAKFSRATGIAVETMSAMGFAAERSGSSLEGFQKGAKGLLIQMQGVRDGMAESQRAFDQLGVTVLTESGNLRGFEDVFGDIAQALSEMSNETEKAAIAQRVFGRSGLALVPLLESGRQGIKDLTDEAERLGITFDEKAAREAEAAADALTNFGTAMKALGQDLSTTVIPAITEVANGLAKIISAQKDFSKIPTEDLIVQDVGKLRTIGDIFGEIGLIIGNINTEVEVSGGRFSALASFMSAAAKARMEMKSAEEAPTEEEDPAKIAERIALIGKQNMDAIKARIAARKEESSIFKNQLAARAQALKVERDLGQLIEESGLRAKEELDEVIEKLAFIREQEKLLAETALFWRRDLVLVKELTIGISNAISNALINAQNLGDALESIIRQLASRALAGLIGGGFASLFGLGAFGAVFSGISGFQGGGRFTVPGPDTGADDRFVMIRTRGQEEITARPQSQVTHQRFDSGVTIQRLEISTRTIDEQFVRYELLPLLNRIERQGSRVNASRIRTS